MKKVKNMLYLRNNLLYMLFIVFYLFVQPVSAQSVPTDPSLSLSVTGTTVNLSWSADNADTYILYAAPYPDASVIYDFDMGNQTSISFDLPADSAFYVATRASNSAGLSGWSNIEHFDWTQNTSPSSPIALSKTQISLESGNSETITISGGTGYYTKADSSNGNVATVTLGADTVNILGVSSGTATITVEDSSGSKATIAVDVIPANCTFSISSSSGDFVSGGGNKTVSVTASNSSCQWSVSESLSWVSVSPTSGTGNQAVTINVDANTGTNTRTGSINFAGHTYNISQEGSATFDGYDSMFTTSASSSIVSINGYLHAGSSFACSIKNISNQKFELSKAALLNGYDIIGETSDMSLLSDGLLEPSESVSLQMTLKMPMQDKGVSFIYYLSDISTGEAFEIQYVFKK